MNKNKELWELADNTYIPWIPVTEKLPKRPEFDWVLVRIEFKEGGKGVPHIAEFINGVWYSSECEGNMEEILAVKVTHWKPIPDEEVR